MHLLYLITLKLYSNCKIHLCCLNQHTVSRSFLYRMKYNYTTCILFDSN